MRKEWRRKIGKSFDFLVIASIAIQQMLIPATRANAFPIYAQQAYKNPREANGRIVCANCHLAAKTVELETPQSILPDQVFETTVKIPYDTSKKQILGKTSRIQPNLHYGVVEDGTKEMYGSYDVAVADCTDRLVQYVCHWEKDFIRIYYDGALVFETTDQKILNKKTQHYLDDNSQSVTNST